MEINQEIKDTVSSDLGEKSLHDGNTSQKKKFSLKKIAFKKQHILAIASLFMVLLVCGILIVLLLSQPHNNVPPYCQYTYEQSKTCKVHQVKHTKQDLKTLHISDEELAIQQELVGQIRDGAYFNGTRLYIKEDELEIVKLKNDYLAEKEGLFEKYLANQLSLGEQARYNELIEELDTLENVIEELGISEAALAEEPQEDVEKDAEQDIDLKVTELTGTIEKLDKELELLKNAQQELQKEQGLEVSSSEEVVVGPSQEMEPEKDNELIVEAAQIKGKKLVIPSNITSMDIVKKSELFK